MEDLCGAMMQIDTKGTITFWNVSAAAMLALPAEDIVGKNAFETLFDNDQNEKFNIMNVITTGDVYYSFDSYVKTPAGNSQSVTLVCSPLLDDSGEIFGVTILFSSVLII